jgi:hypothetical protein
MAGSGVIEPATQPGPAAVAAVGTEAASDATPPTPATTSASASASAGSSPATTSGAEASGSATSGSVAAGATTSESRTTVAPQTATRAAASTGVSEIVGALGGAADRLIARWMQSQDPKAGKDDVVAKTLDAVAVARAGLDRSGNAPVEEQESRLAYLPLLGSEIRADAGPERMCWPGSRLSVKSVPVAAFWLDMLSLSDSLSLKQFSLEQQRFLLEAATNPRRTAACLEQQAEGARTRQAGSFYFAEAARNPEIIRFLVRDLPVADLEIVGVNLVGDRYVQLKDGFKRREGMLTTPRARIAMIGELGIVLREQNGYSVEVFGSSVNWTLSQN